ncbi:hypothetical protein Nmel_009785 [Mimus melanotis]
MLHKHPAAPHWSTAVLSCCSDLLLTPHLVSAFPTYHLQRKDRAALVDDRLFSEQGSFHVLLPSLGSEADQI